VRVVIVYESLFGNTREVAVAIQDGIRSAMPHAQVSRQPGTQRSELTCWWSEGRPTCTG